MHVKLIIIACAFSVFISSVPITDARSLKRRRRNQLRQKTIRLHTIVGIKNIDQSSRSMQFPDVIPMVFGNMIQGYKEDGDGYAIIHSKDETTELSPLRRRFARQYGPNVAGFVFKRSTAGAFPVPMENTIVVLRLMPVTGSFGNVHIWMLNSGYYNRRQKKKQKLFMLSLIQDFSDNLQRAFGVKKCQRYPTISGLCNSRGNSVSGVTFQELLQENGLKRQPTTELVARSPSARLVSNKLFKSEQSKLAPRNVNNLMVIFGQFIDHEIVATTSEQLDRESDAPIPHPDSTDKMSFRRSGILRYDYSKCCHEGYLSGRVWEKPAFNILTSFIDAGAIYGSDNFRANTLRSFKRGELVLKKRGGELLLPLNNGKDLTFEPHNEAVSEDQELFVSGDARANENPILLAIHTLFAREHNRVCRMLRKWLRKTGRRNQLRNDQWLYTQARQIVIAELQSITFNEYLPALLGNDALGPYAGYDPNIDARISTFHSSFAYRWGHSGVAEEMEIKDKKGTTKKRTLKDLFFSTKLFEEHGVDNLLISAMNTPARDVDTKVVESLRDFLFHPNQAGVLDLVSLNIQRSRDLGVPGYSKVQEVFKTGKGMDNIRPELRKPLLDLYGNIDNIDPYVGGLAEEKVKGSLLGPMFHAINVEQFKRLRDGDRFYYENVNWHPFIESMPVVKRIRSGKIRFMDIVVANTHIWQGDLSGRGSAFRTRANVDPW